MAKETQRISLETTLWYRTRSASLRLGLSATELIARALSPYLDKLEAEIGAPPTRVPDAVGAIAPAASDRTVADVRELIDQGRVLPAGGPPGAGPLAERIMDHFSVTPEEIGLPLRNVTPQDEHVDVSTEAELARGEHRFETIERPARAVFMGVDPALPGAEVTVEGVVEESHMEGDVRVVDRVRVTSVSRNGTDQPDPTDHSLPWDPKPTIIKTPEQAAAAVRVDPVRAVPKPSSKKARGATRG